MDWFCCTMRTTKCLCECAIRLVATALRQRVLGATLISHGSGRRIGEARLMVGNAIRIMCRSPKSRAGCPFAAAIGLRSTLEQFAPAIPDFGNDQHTLAGKGWGAVSIIFARRGRNWCRSRPNPTCLSTRPTGSGQSSNTARQDAGRPRRELTPSPCTYRCGATICRCRLESGSSPRGAKRRE